jgi:hypothetical protein
LKHHWWVGVNLEKAPIFPEKLARATIGIAKLVANFWELS